MLNIIDYFNNVYTLIISLTGLIAFASLIVGGFAFITSTGDPEKLAKARKQILAAFLGILILLSSFFILRSINPELVKLEMPSLSPIPETPLGQPSSQTLIPDILSRIEKIADQVKLFSERIESASQNIKELSDKCNCDTAQSLCVCDGGQDESTCRPLRVYSENNTQPCPDGLKIKESQKNIVAWRDEIVYYKNRAIAEEKDLVLEVDELRELSSYYSAALAIETNEQAKEDFNEQIDRLAEEMRFKSDLASMLTSLAEEINEITPHISDISKLPDRCLLNMGDNCEANCRGECHDLLAGCEPETPNEGNPCPMEDIEDQLRNIQNLQSSIDSIADQIFNKIEEIINFKTIII